MSDRHQFRANWHDYNNGIYFVTICSHKKAKIFGSIVGTRFFASALGEIIEENIQRLPSYYSEVEIYNHVVMPNHIHLVVSINSQKANSGFSSSENLGCLHGPMHGDAVDDYHHNSKLASVIGAFKAGVTRRARTRRIASLPCWQSRYHEHIIRNQHAFDKIMNYIDSNVENWGFDCFNPTDDTDINADAIRVINGVVYADAKNRVRTKNNEHEA